MISNPSTFFDQLEAWHSVERLLVEDLRELLEGPLTFRNRRLLTVVLDRLLDSFPRLLQLKSEGGYLCEVLEAFPHWDVPLNLLRRDNVVCHCALEGLRDRVWHELPLTEIALEVRNKLQHWIETLQAIRQHEHRLVQTALNLDIGGEG